MPAPNPNGIDFVKVVHADMYPAIDPTKSDLSQPSKVVLITGAGRGIGRSIALRYAESGVACIILCARTTSQLDSVEQSIHEISSTIRVRKITIDISDEKQVTAVAETITEDEGRLDILINNAGANNPWVPLADGNSEDYLWTWKINMNGTYLMVKTFLPLLLKTAEKTKQRVDIVNVSSIGALSLAPGASAYQISKMAVMRLSEFIMVEYGAKGVNCIALHPGGVETELGKSGPDWLQAYLIDTPELCAGFVTWFTKGQRTYLNGRYVSVTWDVDELESRKDEIVKGDKLKLRMVM